MQVEISRFERPGSGNNKDCEGCTDVKLKIEGVAIGTVEHSWDI